jgi:hypothetical protein
LKVVRLQDSKATAVGCFRYQAAFSGGWRAGLICPFVSVIPENGLRKIVIRRATFPAEFCLLAVVDRRGCLLLGGGVSQN